MPLRYLLVYLIFRHGKTLLQDISAIYPDLGSNDPPSKQAVLKRMGILNYDVWRKIHNLFLERIYKPMKKETFKGYLLLAVDGTFVTLPESEVLSLVFGKHSYRRNKEAENHSPPQAKLSMIYDVFNRVILDFEICHQDVSEITLLFRHLEVLEDLLKDYKVILLADRYYGSAELFKYCEMKGYKYIVRAKSNFFKRQREKIGKDRYNAWFEVFIDKAWTRRIIRDHIRDYIRDHPLMKIRLIRNHYEYDEEYPDKERHHYLKHCEADVEYFTNMDEDVFSEEEIVNLYHNDRWDIETGYGTMKTFVDIEQLNSRNPITVMNEISSKIIFTNLESLIFKACEDKEDKDHLPNNKHIIEMCRSSKFISSFFKRKFENTYLKKLIEECSRVKVMVRKDRHYKRWGKFRKTLKQDRHRIDGRNNPPLRLTKAGILTSNV